MHVSLTKTSITVTVHLMQRSCLLYFVHCHPNCFVWRILRCSLLRTAVLMALPALPPGAAPG